MAFGAVDRNLKTLAGNLTLAGKYVPGSVLTIKYRGVYSDYNIRLEFNLILDLNSE